MKPWRCQRLFRQLVLLAILLALTAAVANDTIYGPAGLNAKRERENRIEVLNADLAALKRQRAQLENEAELLGDRAAREPALLEERARALLDLAHPSDIVIIDDRAPVR